MFGCFCDLQQQRKLRAMHVRESFKSALFYLCMNLPVCRHLCSYDYQPSRSLCCRQCQPTPLRFRDKFPLKVKRAPEPSTIVWENMDTSHCERFARQIVSLVVTLVLLFACVILFAFGQAQRKGLSQQCFEAETCEFQLPSTYYQVSYTCKTLYRIVRGNPFPDYA